MLLTPDLLAAGLATWQIVEIWRHSFIFASWRAWVEAHGGFLSDMLMCPFCLSTWVGAWAAAVMIMASSANEPWLAYLVYAFAASRLANLGNDVFHQWTRTAREDLPHFIERKSVESKSTFEDQEPQEESQR